MKLSIQARFYKPNPTTQNKAVRTGKTVTLYDSNGNQQKTTTFESVARAKRELASL